MNTQTLAAAMGHKEGDFLQLSNHWATVYVAREKREHPKTHKVTTCYVVTGAISDIRATEKVYPTLSRAVGYAIKSLGDYRRGSPNK